MAGSESAGNVASSRTLNLGEMRKGTWVQHTDGRVLELIEYDPRRGGELVFVDVAKDVDLPLRVDGEDGPSVVRVRSMIAARVLAGVVRDRPPAPPVADR